ncbi:MAG TPA: glycine--tRNA ligase [Clostridiaceae bacterium]|nr:glycine--tRNA ligase [Clostridiaceae bacterium]
MTDAVRLNPNGYPMEKLVALAKNRGFVYAGSEIYGGLANAWDYGPYGSELLNTVKAAWWRRFVTTHPLNVGIDAQILMNPEVWVASGHVGGFSDPLIDCKQCKARYRADQLIENELQKRGEARELGELDAEGLKTLIDTEQIDCPSCGKHDFTDIRQFNLMFKTFQGVTEEKLATLYLRPETAQGIFVNFANVQRTSRKKLPFGIAQIGKSFRNEITPGNFIFRTREFEQMELEFFCEPGSDLEWFDYWRTFCRTWLIDIGLRSEHLRLRDHSPDELSFYSAATTDIEFLYPFGWGELWGIADRTNYDLGRHMEHSRQDLSYFDPARNEKFIPYVIEPSLGANRLLLALLADAYDEETLENGDVRTVLRFAPAMAPVKVAVLPLSAKLSEAALPIFERLTTLFSCEFDDRQSIGKRYRRQDEIGTPYCLTFDFDSLDDHMVTVRERDTMRQERLPIDALEHYFDHKFDLS